MKNELFFALWDTSEANTTFGNLLIFLAEIEAIATSYNKVDIAYVGSENHRHLFLSVVCFISKIGNILFFSNRSEYNSYRAGIKADQWLSKIDNINSSSYNGSTLFLQKFYNESKNAKRLTIPEYLKPKINRWLKKHSDGFDSVVVHLKNNPKDVFSNANQKDWLAFFQYVLKKNRDVKFILIGNDQIDKNIISLSNVVLTKDNGGDTELDIALILSASLFLGMSSGPCNVAVFSNVPYIIWKHPNHHVAEMQRELKADNKFSFAKNNQIFLREYDNLNSLISHFEQIHSNLG